MVGTLAFSGASLQARCCCEAKGLRRSSQRDGGPGREAEGFQLLCMEHGMRLKAGQAQGRPAFPRGVGALCLTPRSSSGDLGP